MRISYTLAGAVSKEGIGLFTGKKTTLTLSPLAKGEGIVFKRGDLEGKPTCPARLEYVQGTPRCTIVGGESFSIQTVEHLLSALHAYHIQDVLIEVSGPEMPIFDGSALPFVEMLEEAGVKENGIVEEYLLDKPIYFSEKGVDIVALPSEENRISYTLDYPHSSCIGTQFFSLPISRESFVKELAPCRTFSVYEEIAPLIEKGFLKGGSLENAVVVKGNKVANPEGLRLPGEMVRHKILDMLGDLCLTGLFFRAHIIAIRSGHYANSQFGKKLVNYFTGGNL